MHQVVIVDDEVLARNHLLKLIAWEAHGYRICGVFDSGTAAVKQLPALQPDIIISDVYMPGMDGVALSGHLNTARLTARLIMLSSYDRYDYVRETFRNGAVDYLLKDRLSPESLLAALEKARSGLKEYEADASAAAAPSPLPVCSDAERRRIVRNGLLGQDAAPAVSLQQMANCGLDKDCFIVIALRITNGESLTKRFTEKEKELWVQSLLALHEQNFTGTMAYIGESRFAVLYPAASYRSELKLGEDIRHYATRLAALYAKFMNVQLAYGISAPFKEAGLMAAAFSSAMEQIDTANDGQDPSAADQEPLPGDVPVIGVREEAELIEGFTDIQTKGASPYVKKAVGCMRDRYREDLSLGEVAGHIGIHPAYLSRLFRQEMGVPFVEYLNKIRIESAKTMIGGGLKIKDIYEQVGFHNYNYFFRVFKSVEGMTPTQYERRKRAVGLREAKSEGRR
ncbi:response regulator transcription factor [Paenibacillus spongiae]|uniref:Response regulator n=1 Tax=Paenibacillus spongiae TaxID=2909671 RepID=A0ABY5S5G7_9BACL|nr:helix-turn-helix domain-containing protein [Paenibacillus spongiae]UVI29146.1 response regulator [Paenibacillus spongiae]